MQRQIQVLKCPFNNFKDAEFVRSNSVLNAILVHNKKEGKEDQVQHKKPFSSADLEGLVVYFKNAENSVLLTEYCWFIMTIHNCLRGRGKELQCSLNKEGRPCNLTQTTCSNGHASHILPLIGLSKVRLVTICSTK